MPKSKSKETKRNNCLTASSYPKPAISGKEKARQQMEAIALVIARSKK